MRVLVILGLARAAVLAGLRIREGSDEDIHNTGPIGLLNTCGPDGVGNIK